MRAEWSHVDYVAGFAYAQDTANLLAILHQGPVTSFHIDEHSELRGVLTALADPQRQFLELLAHQRAHYVLERTAHHGFLALEPRIRVRLSRH